ncbi:helix-turn-helix transcriptional regulator [uncultured Flavonifractor sp.]|uniref:helix-turn-helix transcriptional regulator n=1 Tax=uncultured Flavonifractor sp. TaxID=1193534 RepID=UPI002601EB3D|nr:WYL domain-containing protein [uncultured Flavonifractor sp.]
MPRSTNQKLKLLCLSKLLWEQTDEDHPMTVPELIQALEEWGIKAERKSIYDDMEALRVFGLDVQNRKGRDPGWFLGERNFQLAELKLLVDAVQSSRFISQRKSNDLIAKLEALASRHQARQLQRQVYVDRRAKTMNESVYYTIDKLHAAIAHHRSVSFKYFEYNVRKERVFRREGKRYDVSPAGLIWDNENYYLAGFDHRFQEMRHYRVDKMAELAVTCLPLEGVDSEFDIASYAKKHFGMFSGQEGQVTLRCKNQMVGVVLDRFGREVILVPDGEDHFTVTVQAVVSPQFLGWVFGLGDGVTIKGPDWAARKMADQLAAVAELYQKT